jgi:hypothetical protein
VKWSRLGAIAVVAALVSGCGSSSATASHVTESQTQAQVPPRLLNQTSAEGYIRDATDYVRVLIGTLDASESAVKRFVAEVRSGCADVLGIGVDAGGGASDRVVGSLTNEEIDDVNLVETGPEEKAAAGYSLEVARLQWSNAKITHLLGSVERRISAINALRPTDFCADLKSAAAGRLASTPPETTRFLKLVHNAREPGGKSIPPLSSVLALMKPYVPARYSRSITTLEKLNSGYTRAFERISINDAAAPLGGILFLPPSR